MKKSITALVISGSIGLSQLALATTPQINPYEGAHGYVNPDYAKQVNNFFDSNLDYKKNAAELGLLDKAGKWTISTAIWLDSMAAIEGEQNRSQPIRIYLDEAAKEATQAKPVVVTIVIYDLPLRDCNAHSSNGEFKSAKDLDTYKTKYIDVIKSKFDAFYKENANAKNVRLALVIEPDSLPNLITNAITTDNPLNRTSIPQCQLAADSNVYVDGISHALKQFSTNPNIFMYVDIAHSGWMGWKNNATGIAAIYNSKKLGDGFNSVRGFITNTANYTPLKEAFSYDEYVPYHDKTSWIMTSKYYDWSLAYDEVSYMAEILSLDKISDTSAELHVVNNRIGKAVNPLYKNMHFLTDTSRNGWMMNSTDYRSGFDNDKEGIPYKRYDQRHHRGNWCNVQSVMSSKTSYDNPKGQKLPTIPTSSGFGELPKANPKISHPIYGDNLPIDAYVWIKPPGESDGFYDKNESVGMQGDRMCGPGIDDSQPSNNDSQQTDSLQRGSKSAPKAGVFFKEAFKNMIDTSMEMKVNNARR